jgi:hypothetical protein
MRARYVLAIVLFALLGTVLIVRYAVGPGPPGAQAHTKSYPELQEARGEPAEVLDTAAAPVTPTSEPVASRATTTLQGPSLLAIHCAQCHVIEGLLQIKKSLSEWDYTLTQMETLGADLDEQEKQILLDFLAVTD